MWVCRRGREREAAFIDHVWHDVMIAILDREYAKAQRGKA
jgi:hypothetical protein